MSGGRLPASGPDFWWRPPGLAATLLSPLGALYGAVAGSRMRRAGARAGVPVICVGNATLGGAGKTPTSIALAARLQARGAAPFLLTRGYGGQLSGPVRVEPALHDAGQVGDEPLLLARAAPTIVAADRVAGARLAVREGAGVIVMDDGFQNPSLAKDVSLMVVDGASGFGNGMVFPAGPLRAPLAAQVARAGAILAIGEGEGRRAAEATARDAGIALIGARLVPDPEAAARLAGQRVLAFAGLARPQKFAATLTAIGAETAEFRPFPDHHGYGEADAEALLKAAEADGLVLATTEKDFVKLKGGPLRAALARRAIALPITIAFEDEAAIETLLARALDQRGR